MGFILQIGMDDSPIDKDNEFNFGKYVQKIIYNKEKVWSENTRRNSSAKMQGKIVAIKYTLEISIVPFCPRRVISMLKDRIDSTTEWHRIRFSFENSDYEDNTTNEKAGVKERTFYFGNPSYEPYWFADNEMMMQSLNFKAIER